MGHFGWRPEAALSKQKQSKSKYPHLSWNNIVTSFQRLSHRKKKQLHHGHKASYLFYFVFLATCKALGFHRVDYQNIYMKAEICWSHSCKPDYSRLEAVQA